MYVILWKYHYYPTPFSLQNCGVTLMNFRQKMVYILIGCTLILVVLFAVISTVGFNSQNASAAPNSRSGMNEVGIKIPNVRLGMNEVSIKIKINVAATTPASKYREEAIKETIKNTLENVIRDKTNLRVVTYGGKPRSEWGIYYLINQQHGTAGMSITLTHQGRFVMNHIKAIRIDAPVDPGPFIDDMIEVVLNVIQQKMKNKDATIIVTDKSTIVN